MGLSNLIGYCVAPHCRSLGAAMAEVTDSVRHCAVIKFLIKEGAAPASIHEHMKNVYGDSAPSYATVKRWAVLFRLSREPLEDDGRLPSSSHH